MNETIMTSVVTSLITTLIPAIVTLVSNAHQSKENRKNAAQTRILQLITDDEIRVMRGMLPVNLKDIEHDFDIYKENYGNSYMERRVQEYRDWYDSLATPGVK